MHPSGKSCPNPRCVLRVYRNEAGDLVHADGLYNLRDCYPVGSLDDWPSDNQEH